MIFIASELSIAPMTPVMAFDTPMVSHVPSAPAGGTWGFKHLKQAVFPGIIDMVMPFVPTAPPYTHGIPFLTHVSFTKKRVSMLSVPSTTTSVSLMISSILLKFTSFSNGSMDIFELTLSSFLAAAMTFGSPTSPSSYSV